jgi:putative membrane protein
MSQPSTESDSSASSASPAPEEIMPRDIEWQDAPRIIASGFAMGSADVVPGVSGGTMAVACGIYERL